MIVYGYRYGWCTILFDGCSRKESLNWIFENCDVGDLVQVNGRWCGRAYYEDGVGCVYVIFLENA